MKKRSLSANELQGLANELLKELLEHSERGTKKSDGAWESTNVQLGAYESFEGCFNGGRAWGFGGAAEEFGTDKKISIEAEKAKAQADFGYRESLPMIRQENFYPELHYGGGRTPRRAKGYRYEGIPSQTKIPETAQTASVRTETAESLSEVFCRDARRYDGAFEKY